MKTHLRRIAYGLVIGVGIGFIVGTAALFGWVSDHIHHGHALVGCFLIGALLYTIGGFIDEIRKVP